MDHNKDMNNIRLQMIDLAKMLGRYKHVMLEIKVKCPFCGEYTLLLKEKGAHYWCMNDDCGREGSLDELEFYVLEELMQKPRGVKL